METTCRCWISLFYYGKNLLCISFVREYFSSRLARGGYFFQRLNSSLHSDNIHQRKRSRRPPSLFRHNHRLGPGFHSVNVPFRRRLSNDSSPITAFTTRSPQSTAVHPFPGFTHIDSQFSSRAPLKLQGFLDWFVGCEDLSALPISYR
ncbi:unnamed protein product [Linum trigynum]|uniref:Uncharacterized protein n=1 Tax=Linum trigynum TaxID=586398 RepID=A0AAV2ENK5_9ROSI